MKTRILIVEDEYIAAHTLRMSLELGFGYQVVPPVATGEEAIACVEKDPRIDAILMDIRLSGQMDGIAAARQITDRHPIPIVFMTGYSYNETMRDYQSPVPYAYLEKPVGPEKVNQAIQSVLGCD